MTIVGGGAKHSAVIGLAQPHHSIRSGIRIRCMHRILQPSETGRRGPSRVACNLLDVCASGDDLPSYDATSRLTTADEILAVGAEAEPTEELQTGEDVLHNGE